MKKQEQRSGNGGGKERSRRERSKSSGGILRVVMAPGPDDSYPWVVCLCFDKGDDRGIRVLQLVETYDVDVASAAYNLLVSNLFE